MDPVTDQGLRGHVLDALVAARRTAFHFPACFLNLSLPHIDAQSSEGLLPHGEFNSNADGSINLAAIGMLADLTASAAMRRHIAPRLRMATISMHLRLNGRPLKGDMRAMGRFEGPIHGLSPGQGRSGAQLQAGGTIIGSATVCFSNPPAPDGVALSPVEPFNYTVGKTRGEPEAPADDTERAILGSAENCIALAQKDTRYGFIEQFWGMAPLEVIDGRATTTMVPGPHNGNRVGHVQGGILFGAAATCARGLAAELPVMTEASAWFLRPAAGPQLRIESSLLHRGRTMCVIRTGIVDAAGKTVVEMVSSHGQPE